MPFVPSHRLRAFVLTLALAFGLAGQTFAPSAMAMQPDHGVIAGVALSPSDGCPGCAGLDHAKAMLADCAVGLCSGVVAVLPSALSPPTMHHISFSQVAESDGQGITIPPALGPPRPSHLT